MEVRVGVRGLILNDTGLVVPPVGFVTVTGIGPLTAFVAIANVVVI